MKIKWAHTLIISVVAVIVGMTVSFLLIFNGFHASTDLPKTVSIFAKKEDGKKVKLGALKFESGIDKAITAASTKITSEEISGKEALDVKQLLFHYNPYLLIWGLIIVILTGLGAGTVPIVCDRISTIREEFQIEKKIMALMIGIVILFGCVMLVTPALPSYLSYYTFWTPFTDVIFTNHNTINYVAMTILTLAMPALLGIATLFIAGKKLQKRIKDEPEKAKATFIDKFKEIQNALSFFLVILTILITLTVLGTGAFRKALLAAVSVEGLDIAPVEFVYLYGVFFTVFLALFYSPVYLQLLSFKQETKTNSKLAEFKQNEVLQGSNWETIKILASLLAPLLSSILPGILS